MWTKCVWTKCVVTKCCGDKVCVDKVYGNKVWRRAGGGGEGGGGARDIESKTRTPHKDVGNDHPSVNAIRLQYRGWVFRLLYAVWPYVL